MGPGWGRGESLRRIAGVWLPTAFCLTASALIVWPAQADMAATASDLDRMPIEDLAKIAISSVSKTTQPLSDAAASIYVITHEDILRSGAASLPEILRLAPNLFIAQTSASQYVITARGFSGNGADQNYSDKLLVLIDGRSVYTPLYSGVYWDMQGVLPEDIDRIEVISGPGATLWGANAVNGVINIITRKSADTQGGYAELTGGNLTRSVSLRYGGRIGDDLAWRAYVTDFADRATATAAGANAHDAWSRPQGGFRLDWTPSTADTVTLQGDAYRGQENQLGGADSDIGGENLLGRWNHAWDGGAALQVQAYFDRTQRKTLDGGGSLALDTWDLDLQHSFAFGRRNQIVWGGGVRVDQYQLNGPPQLTFAPPSRTLTLADLFVQDSFSLTDAAKLILGLKLEDDPYAGVSALPNARLSWKAADGVLVWAAVSQAIRSPTPFDRDVQEKLGDTLFLVGGADFRPERLTAYEIGARLQPAPQMSVSVSVYDNDYAELRSVEFNPVTLLPLFWGNRLRAETYGLEAWGDYALTPAWRIAASADLFNEHVTFAPGASQLLGAAQLGDDPRLQTSLRSSANLGHHVSFDAELRHVGPLPNPHLPAYTELDSRLAWSLNDQVQLSLAGFNLLNPRHQEFAAPADPVQRSVVAGLQWRF